MADLFASTLSEARIPGNGGPARPVALPRMDSSQPAQAACPACPHSLRALARSWLRPACLWLAVLCGILLLIRWDQTLIRSRPALLHADTGLFKQVRSGFRDFCQVLPIATAAVIVYLADRRRLLIITTLLLALSLGALACHTTKLCIPRYRPREVMPTTLRWTDTWAPGWSKTDESRPDSFPSGHSYAAFAFAAVLAWSYPRLRYVFWTLAIGCAASRFIDAVHWPSDCLAGAAIGYAAAWISLRVCSWIFQQHSLVSPGRQYPTDALTILPFPSPLPRLSLNLDNAPQEPSTDYVPDPTSHRSLSRWNWTRQPKGLLLLLSLCLCLYLPGLFSLPPIDRDESRYVEASRCMVAAHTPEAWLVPRIQGRPFLCKPPLTYWLQAATVWITGGQAQAQAPIGAVAQATNGLPARGIWAYRLPSVAGALTAVALTWALGRRMFGGAVPWLAALFLGTCLVMMTSLRQACTDQLLLAFTMLAQWALWEIWQARNTPRPARLAKCRPRPLWWPSGGRASRPPSWDVQTPRRAGNGLLRWPLLLWLAVALGAMTKGPVTPAIVLWTCITLCLISRQWRWLWHLRPILGIAILAAVITPWALALGATIGWTRFLDVLRYEIISRSLSPMEGHAAFPGYHTLLLPVLLWPGSLALFPAFWRAFNRGLCLSPTQTKPTYRLQRILQAIKRVHAGRPAEFFCLAWLVPGWLAFELVATKLPHYTLPLYPAIALLCARGVVSIPAWQRITTALFGRLAIAGWVLLSTVLALLAPIVAAVLGLWHPPARAVPLAVALGLVAIAGFGLTLQAARNARFLRMQIAAITSGVAMALLAFHFILPHLDALWLSSGVAADLQRLDPASRAPIASVGYQEDSLIFLTGGRVARLKWFELRRWLREHPTGLAVVEDSPLLPTDSIECLAKRRGFNYTKGEWSDLLIVRARTSPQPNPAHDV